MVFYNFFYSQLNFNKQDEFLTDLKFLKLNICILAKLAYSQIFL